jgi:hypothetical protein
MNLFSETFAPVEIQFFPLIDFTSFFGDFLVAIGPIAGVALAFGVCTFFTTVFFDIAKSFLGGDHVTELDNEEMALYQLREKIDAGIRNVKKYGDDFRDEDGFGVLEYLYVHKRKVNSKIRSLGRKKFSKKRRGNAEFRGERTRKVTKSIKSEKVESRKHYKKFKSNGYSVIDDIELDDDLRESGDYIDSLVDDLPEEFERYSYGRYDD